MSQQPLLIGVSARIYYPGSQGPLPGVFTKTLHYLEQSVAHWVLSGHAMAVMVPAVTKDSIVLRSDLDLADYAQALDGLVLQGGNDVAPECYGESPLKPEWAGDPVRDKYEIELIKAFIDAGRAAGMDVGEYVLKYHTLLATPVLMLAMALTWTTAYSIPSYINCDQANSSQSSKQRRERDRKAANERGDLPSQDSSKLERGREGRERR